MVGVRHIYANAGLFVILFIGNVVFDGLYVVLGQPHGSVFDALAPVLGFLAIAAIYSVNWWLTHTSRWGLRMVVAAGVAMVAVAVGFIPYVLLGLWFHFRIGGTL